MTVTTNFVWDMHADVNNATMTEGMGYMGPPLDHALSAFLEDLEARGLSDDVLLVEHGGEGVISSGLEARALRQALGKRLLIVSPGIRPVENRPADDQKRVLSPGEAMRAGADYLVVGRPILDAPDPLAVAREVVADMARGLLASRARLGTR